jgi:hypothetical protein
MSDEVVCLSATCADGKVVIDEFFRLIGDVIEYQTAVSVKRPEILPDSHPIFIRVSLI